MYLANIDEGGSKRSTFNFGLLKHCCKHKDCIQSTPLLTEAELLWTKHAVLLSNLRHGAAHPDSEQPQNVGGNGNGAVLRWSHGVTTLNYW